MQDEGHIEFQPIAAELTDSDIAPESVDSCSDAAPGGDTRHIVPVVLEFKDLHLGVPVKDGVFGPKTYKPILNGVSGYAKPGELLAIMGPSGSGKSSLLNCLTGRIPVNFQMTGSVTVNGAPLSRSFSKRMLGYVVQDDHLIPNQTVRECLEFSANLRLADTMTDEEKRARVDTVVADLGLRKVADTNIGNNFRSNISGGERKRVSIGLEVTRDVSVLLADEPTTGLDSYVAYNVITALKDLARKHNMAVVATVHQPRSQIWDLFDSVLVLSEGKVMYFGPAKESLTFLKEIGAPCPEDFNPGDFFLDLVSVDFRSKELEAETRDRVERVAEKFKQRSATREARQAAEAAHAAAVEARCRGVVRQASFWLQLKELGKRVVRERVRDKFGNILRLLMSALFAVLFGLVFSKHSDTQAGVQNRVGLLFFVLIQQAFGNLFPLMVTLMSEKSVFHRENLSGYYGTTAYFLTRTMIELPLTLIFPVVYGCILYWMAGLQASAGKFLIFLLTLVLSTWSAEGLAYAIAAVSRSLESAQVITPVILLLFVLMGGFYANNASLSPFFKGLSYVSFFKYAYNNMMLNEFSGLTFTCTPSELVYNSQGVAHCPFSTGQSVLTAFDVKWTIPINTAVLVAMVVGYRLFAYVIVRLTKPRFKSISGSS